MRNLLSALLILLLAGTGAIYFAGDTAEQDAANAGASPLDEDYDYYIQNVRTTRFGSDGAAVSQLEAERVTHFPDGDRAELQKPQLETFGVEGDAWRVAANAGTLAPDPQRDEDRLDLAGDVQLRKPLQDGDFIEMSTSALTVFPGTEQAETSAPVALRMAGSQLDGIGLEARLAENYVHLNNSKGTHAPSPSP